MNSNPDADEGPAPLGGASERESATRQIDRLFLEAGDARAALSELPADAPVLLVTFQGSGSAGVMPGEGWENALAKSLLAQVNPNQSSAVLVGPSGLELHPAARLAFCAGQELNLTSTEFALLQELLNQGGSVVSVDALSRTVWGHDTLGAPNYVEAHISRLRRKLREIGAGRIVETVRGSGYRVRPPRLVPAASEVREMRPVFHESEDERDAAA